MVSLCKWENKECKTSLNRICFEGQTRNIFIGHATLQSCDERCFRTKCVYFLLFLFVLLVVCLLYVVNYKYIYICMLIHDKLFCLMYIKNVCKVMRGDFGLIVNIRILV